METIAFLRPQKTDVGRPPWVGAPLYVAGGPTAAPGFPHGGAIGFADGSGNNCLIHIIAQILDAAERGDQRLASREKCVYVRHSLVVKYGCILHAALELEVWRHLIIEELGGRPNEWHVLCWSGFGGESAQCVGAGERCARLCHTVGPPGHFVPIWSAIVCRAARRR